jgi:hypothetical protein
VFLNCWPRIKNWHHGIIARNIGHPVE